MICTDTFAEHIRILNEIAKRLREAGLSISITKSHFCRKQTKFLGYLISTEGIHADPARVDPILKLAQPQNIKAVRSLIGAANWYRRFIPKFSDLVAPITELLKKSPTCIMRSQPKHWNERTEVNQRDVLFLAAPKYWKAFLRNSENKQQPAQIIQQRRIKQKSNNKNTQCKHF